MAWKSKRKVKNDLCRSDTNMMSVRWSIIPKFLYTCAVIVQKLRFLIVCTWDAFECYWLLSLTSNFYVTTLVTGKIAATIRIQDCTIHDEWTRGTSGLGGSRWKKRVSIVRHFGSINRRFVPKVIFSYRVAAFQFASNIFRKRFTNLLHILLELRREFYLPLVFNERFFVYGSHGVARLLFYFSNRGVSFRQTDPNTAIVNHFIGA